MHAMFVRVFIFVCGRHNKIIVGERAEVIHATVLVSPLKRCGDGWMPVTSFIHLSAYIYLCSPVATIRQFCQQSCSWTSIFLQDAEDTRHFRGTCPFREQFPASSRCVHPVAQGEALPVAFHSHPLDPIYIHVDHPWLEHHAMAELAI